MSHPQRFRTALLLTLITLSTSTVVFAHGGHGDEFQETTNAQPSAIKVDPETAQRLGLKIEPVSKKQLDIVLQATGQIETLPSKKVELTAPIPSVLTLRFFYGNFSYKKYVVVFSEIDARV